MAWIFIAFTFCVASATDRQFVLWGSLMLVTVPAFAFFVAMLSFHGLRDSQQKHVLTIDGDQVSLYSYDQQLRMRVNKQISLEDVTSAEYFQPSDTASLVLNGGASNLEIPLWAFGQETEKQIVNCVKSSGVKIIGNPK